MQLLHSQLERVDRLTVLAMWHVLILGKYRAELQGAQQYRRRQCDEVDRNGLLEALIPEGRGVDGPAVGVTELWKAQAQVADPARVMVSYSFAAGVRSNTTWSLTEVTHMESPRISRRSLQLCRQQSLDPASR